MCFNFMKRNIIRAGIIRVPVIRKKPGQPRCSANQPLVLAMTERGTMVKAMRKAYCVAE